MNNPSNRRASRRPLPAVVMIALVWFAPGCAAPPRGDRADRIAASGQSFREIAVPRKVGTVATVGAQLPTFSPDGDQMAYLRTNQAVIRPLTFLGSSDPQDMPPDGSLAIWLRPTRGAATGRRLSPEPWAHSAVWSGTGRSIAYVVNESPSSSIVHVNLFGDQRTRLGVAGAVNCLPRFDGDDETLLFCSGPSSSGPFRVYRQHVGETEPTPLTPIGMDCVLPIRSDADGRVVCARPAADTLQWITADAIAITEQVPQAGAGRRPTWLNTWAGIATPLSPDRQSVLFFDTVQQRVRIWHVAERRVRGHRLGTIAGCWLSEDVVALAAENALLIVETSGGVLMSLRGSSWIPRQYVPSARRLILLGREGASRFSIYEMTFVDRETLAESASAG